MIRTILIFFTIVVALLALTTALTSAAANLANGVAFAVASTALQTSQCITGFMVLVTIVAGIDVGFGLAYFRTLRLQRQARPWNMPLPWSGNQRPFGHKQPVAGYLLDPGTRLPSVYLPAERNVQAQEAEDILFKNWGW